MVFAPQDLEPFQATGPVLLGAIAAGYVKHANAVWMERTPSSSSGDSPVWISLKKGLEVPDVCWPTSREIQVKNTFIHMEEDGSSDSECEDGGDIAMRKSKSAPTPKCISPAWLSVGDEAEEPDMYQPLSRNMQGKDSASNEFKRSCVGSHSESNNAVAATLAFESVQSVSSSQSSSPAWISLGRGLGVPDVRIPISRKLRVKNTFIQIDEDGCSESESESIDAGIVMLKSKSAPAPRCMSPRPHQISLAAEVCPGGQSNTSSASNTPTELELRLSTLSAEERACLPSVGAALHGSGDCRPCAFFWKDDGCSNGMDCFHCHACPKGEMRHRKKAKRNVHRQARLASLGKLETVAVSDLDED